MKRGQKSEQGSDEQELAGGWRLSHRRITYASPESKGMTVSWE